MNESIGDGIYLKKGNTHRNMTCILKGYLMVEMSVYFVSFPKTERETMRVIEVYFGPI